jgi:NifU-like protein involved in Fe-S cluster formation
VVTIYLKLHPDGRTISDAHFAGEGCGVSQAAASLLLEHLHQHGWTLDDVIQADFRLVQELVGPEAARARPQCASLALSVLKAAVQKVERSRRHAEVERARDETNES